MTRLYVLSARSGTALAGCKLAPSLPRAVVHPYLSASRRPCYPAASQYLHWIVFSIAPQFQSAYRLPVNRKLFPFCHGKIDVSKPCPTISFCMNRKYCASAALCQLSRHHTLSRPLHAQGSRHISCLTAYLPPCVFLCGAAHNNTALRSVPVTCCYNKSFLCCRTGRLPTAAGQRPPVHLLIRAALIIVTCRLTRHV